MKPLNEMPEIGKSKSIWLVAATGQRNTSPYFFYFVYKARHPHLDAPRGPNTAGVTPYEAGSSP